MEQVVDVPRQEIITKDNATVSVDGVAFYQVLDVRRASYEIANLQQALLNLVMTNIRTVMGSLDLDQLLSHRDEINRRLLGVIDAASQPWGLKVTRIEIKDIEPPKDLVKSMARQMKAEREKRAGFSKPKACVRPTSPAPKDARPPSSRSGRAARGRVSRGRGARALRPGGGHCGAAGQRGDGPRRPRRDQLPIADNTCARSRSSP